MLLVLLLNLIYILSEIHKNQRRKIKEKTFAYRYTWHTCVPLTTQNKDPLQLSETNTPIFKTGKRLDQEMYINGQLAGERCSTSLITWEMHIKTIIRYSARARCHWLRRQQHRHGWRLRDVGNQLQLPHGYSANPSPTENSPITARSGLAVSHQVKSIVTTWPSDPTTARYLPKRK